MIALIKNHFKEIAKLKKSPLSIATGAAVGTFISILPTPFMNIFIGLIIILLFKKINKFSLFGSMLFWNPLTLVPIYYYSYKIGDYIFDSSPVLKIEFNLVEQVFNFSRRFLVGNIIIAIIISILTFLLIFFISKKLINKPKKFEKSMSDSKQQKR